MIAHPSGRNWVDAPTTANPLMTDDRQPDLDYLRCELLDRVDQLPFHEWSPDLLRALIAVFDLNGITPATRHHFRPYLVR